MKQKQLMAVLLGLVMTATLLSGCGQTGTGNSGTEVSKEVAKESSVQDVEPTKMEISFISWNCGEVEDNTMAEEWLETKLEEKLEGKYDIELTIPRIDISNAEALNLMLNTGEAPDCGWWMGEKTHYDDGITRSIPEDMIREYAPNYAAILDADPVGWDRSRLEDDEYLFLTGYQPTNGPAGCSFVLQWNYDWLKKGGFTPNGEVIELKEGKYLATEPFTQSEAMEIFKYFAKGDPDGNGANDTYAFSVCGENFKNLYGSGWGAVTTMYSLNTLSPVEEDGVHKNYYVTESYKNFLKYAAELYELGYIDPEYAVFNAAQKEEQINTARTGMQVMAYVNMGWGTTNGLLASGGSVLVTPVLVNDEGEAGIYPYNKTNFAYNFGVNADVDDEKLAVILQMFDLMCTDKEAQIMLQWGVEGEHFKYTSEVDGEKVACESILDPSVNAAAKYGIQIFNNYWSDADFYRITGNPVFAKVAPYSQGEWAKYTKLQSVFDATGNATEYDEYEAQYGPTIEQLVDEYRVSVITGVADVESSWEGYVKSLYDAGYNKLEEELQKMPEFVMN